MRSFFINIIKYISTVTLHTPSGPTAFVSVDDERREEEEDNVGGHERHYRHEEVIHDGGTT